MIRPWIAISILAGAMAPLADRASDELPPGPSTRVAADWFQKIGTATGDKLDRGAGEELVNQLRTANPAERELLIERLLPLSGVAAEASVSLFAEQSLATRLAVLEILEAWHAPIEGIDPWEPATITPQRLDALKSWARSSNHTSPATGPTTSPSAASIDSELGHLVACKDDQEALLIRIRLARFGPAIVPQVVAAIRDHDDETSLERLTTLRYRLVCSDALAVSWPDGIERLASRDSQVRRKAVQELQGRATAQDLELLRELFSDADPFVRELALATIQRIGGNDARNALLALLHDPDANVRAAVLKQLTEAPDPQLVAEIVDYAQKEPDPDLVLHAVRALSTVKTPAAIKGLIALMQHSSWQVRAEAAERARDAVNDLSQARKADVYMAMITLLDDKDSFVVSRALECLQRADLLATLEPMLRAAESHPDLATVVVQAISSGNTMRAKAEPHLRKFCSHRDPAVRAAAIIGLCRVASAPVDTELLGALRDSEADVRFAGACAFYGMLEDLRPYATSNRLTTRTYYNNRAAVPPVDNWLKKFQSGSDRAPWMTQAMELCRAMLNDPVAEHKLYAGLSLIALSRDQQAIDALLQVADRDSQIPVKAAHMMLWLPSDQRALVLDRLLGAVGTPELKVQVAGVLSALKDDAASKGLWALLQAKEATPQLAGTVYDSLRTYYLGERYYDPNAMAGIDRAALLADLKPRVLKGTDLERTVAMCLVAMFDASAAADLAKTVQGDASAGELLRLDALQVRLMALPAAQARTEAIALLNAGESANSKVALPYLSGLDDRLRQFRGTIYVYQNTFSTTAADGTPSIPTFPEGLNKKILADIAASSDDERKPMASYLLALDGDRKALETLIAYWRAHSNREWRDATYRAIAVANDDALTPVLQEIYQGMDKEGNDIQRFYWTIRTIKGMEILKLRKQIRDEVGMDRLR